jgi:Lactoylglutathione lyase and related lyases
VTRFHHVSFTVSDVDAAEAWFVEHFGLVRVGGGDYDFDYIRSQVGMADAVLKVSVLADPAERGDLLELIEYVGARGAPADTATNRPGNAHLCFLSRDIEADYRRLSGRGVRFVSAPNTVTWGINAGARAVYLLGPDDIRLELFQPARAG